MAVSNIIRTPINVYYQDTTTNLSFTKMHYFLRAKGINNNKFFLLIYDAGLMGVDPRDPNLSLQMKLRILRECTSNFWYFIREVVRIPEEGGQLGGGKRYELSRANLALNYMFVYNISTFLELPRQHGKTISALCWYLWVFNFGATNMKMMFANKKHEDSKSNLKTMKNIRAALPEYLRMDSAIGPDGKQIRVPNKAETLQNPINNNIIVTLPGARTPALADGAGRGATMAIQYYDEFAFLPYNDIVYAAAIPAFSKASQNAKLNNAPYGVLITTTPGDLTTREGKFANYVRNQGTEWNESYYDKSYKELMDLINSNPKSLFMHIRYTYQMLGSGAEYFDEMVKFFLSDWTKIRREILLEWSEMSTNNPFAAEDLEIIGAYVREEPISSLSFGKAGQFQMKFWDTIPMGSQYPPIIGVDVSSGIFKDASAITVIDSETTKVIATFRCNYITTPELADLIYRFVTMYARNAIVNIENNGGFGSTLLQILLKTSIKPNLYYEIKERVDEEVFDGITVKKRPRKCKVYGSTSSKSKRDKLIELLHQRVQHHRDKFNSKEILDELKTMVVKPNGKTEHADDAHDDLVFSYLWALYVFYYGEDLVNRYRLLKTEIYTDDHYDETSYSLEEEYGLEEQIDPEVFRQADDEVGQIIDEQLKLINNKKTISYEEFRLKELNEEHRALDAIKRTKPGREAIAKAYNIPLDFLEKQSTSGYIDITNDAMKIFYSDEIENYDTNDDQIPTRRTSVKGNLSDIFSKV